MLKAHSILLNANLKLNLSIKLREDTQFYVDAFQEDEEHWSI